MKYNFAFNVGIQSEYILYIIQRLFFGAVPETFLEELSSMKSYLE